MKKKKKDTYGTLAVLLKKCETAMGQSASQPHKIISRAILVWTFPPCE